MLRRLTNGQPNLHAHRRAASNLEQHPLPLLHLLRHHPPVLHRGHDVRFHHGVFHLLPRLRRAGPNRLLHPQTTHPPVRRLLLRPHVFLGDSTRNEHRRRQIQILTPTYRCNRHSHTDYMEHAFVCFLRRARHSRHRCPSAILVLGLQKEPQLEVSKILLPHLFTIRHSFSQCGFGQLRLPADGAEL